MCALPTLPLIDLSCAPQFVPTCAPPPAQAIKPVTPQAFKSRPWLADNPKSALRAELEAFISTNPTHLRFLGPGGRALPGQWSLLKELTLLTQGEAADAREWESTAVVLIDQEPRSGHYKRYPRILYQDGSIERCPILANGHKDGVFHLSAPQRYLTADALQSGKPSLKPDYYPQQDGSYFHGLPCGKFTCWDENHQVTCAGHYELLEGGALTINLAELTARTDNKFNVRRILPEELVQWTEPAPSDGSVPTLQVSTQAIVVRYQTLSCGLPNGAHLSFEIGPEYPAVTIEREEGETWMMACNRTHEQVLSVVQAQVNALRASQVQAHAALKAELKAAANAPQPTVVGQVAGNDGADEAADDAAATDRANLCAQVRTLLGQVQPPDIVAGAKQGGYASLLWESLVPVDAGDAGDESAYLNALLVSSPEYLKRLCASDKLPGPHYFMKKTGRFVRAPETGYRVLPIWAQWAPAPLKLDAADLAAQFNWQARGSSTLSLLEGAALTLTYGDLGLAHGPWHLYLKDTGEHGTMEQGKLTSTLTFDLYQDGRARFPAAIFTVNLLTGEFEGPYQLIYDISELFDQGYHAVLLEECGDIKTEHGFKTLKRIADYKSGSYLKEQGTYVKGEPQVQQRFKLKRYERPYYRNSFRYGHYGYYRSRY